jgi:hypothetical protein
MVFDTSVALTWILFLALFPISFVWQRRAWRMVVNRDFSEVGIKRGESPPKPEKFAPFEMPVNLVAGGGAGVRDGRRAGWFLGVQHLERHCRQHSLVQVHCAPPESGPIPHTDCHVTTFLSMNTFRHCEPFDGLRTGCSEAIHDFRLHGLPRYARSDANNTVLAGNVVTRQSVCGIGPDTGGSQ